MIWRFQSLIFQGVHINFETSVAQPLKKKHQASWSSTAGHESRVPPRQVEHEKRGTDIPTDLVFVDNNDTTQQLPWKICSWAWYMALVWPFFGIQSTRHAKKIVRTSYSTFTFVCQKQPTCDEYCEATKSPKSSEFLLFSDYPMSLYPPLNLAARIDPKTWKLSLQSEVHQQLELDHEVVNNPSKIHPLELSLHHHHPPSWKKSMHPKYP